MAESIDHRTLDTRARPTEMLRVMDRQMGALAVAEMMRAHLRTLDDALAYAVLPSARRPVAKLYSSASTLAGWQALDVGAGDRAWQHYETARRAAVEAESPALVAHAMGEQAYVLVDPGYPQLAVELIGEAISSATGKAPARLLAWLHSARAELFALAHNGAHGRAALEVAAPVPVRRRRTRRGSPRAVPQRHAPRPVARQRPHTVGRRRRPQRPVQRH